MNSNSPMFDRSELRQPGIAPAATEGTNSILRSYYRIAVRWRFVILGAIGACILTSLIITLLMTPKYAAYTTVEILREAGEVTNFKGVEKEASTGDQEFYQTQYGLLRARSLAERVVGELGLADSREFFLMFDEEDTDEPYFEFANGRYSAAGRAERVRVAREVLLDNTGIAPQRLSRLVDISFMSPDPEFSAKVANSWAKNYIESNLERKIQSTAYGRNLLEKELVDLKQKLDESQRQLVNYAASQEIINLPAQGSDNSDSTSERSIVADDLATLNKALAEATTERIEAQSRAGAGGSAGLPMEALRLTSIGNLRQKRAELAAEYERLLTQFEPGYPSARALSTQIADLDRSIAREESRIRSSLQAEYQQALARENALRQRVAGLKGDFLDLRRRSIQYNIYQQEVDTNRALYDGLLQRYKEIGVAGGVGINNVAIVDAADVPEKPSSPSLPLNLIIALLAGVALGAVIAFILEQIDEAIADPAEIERRLGLTLLGTAPKTVDQSPQEALQDRKSDLVDAYFAIQTNLAFTTEHGAPRVLAVTSTRPAEGKSTTAFALACLMGRTNQKVILVDGDMRSPSVHHLAGVDHERGLSNFLAGDEDLSGLIHEVNGLGISIMSAGPTPPNAAELLTGDRLRQLLTRLLEVYDRVVIDCPPVMGLADAPLIASQVDGVVFAIEAHGIRTGLANTALARLRGTNARILGGVLTKFESDRAHSNYGYAYEYGYGYGQEGRAAKAG